MALAADRARAEAQRDAFFFGVPEAPEEEDREVGADGG
jgi:hypothetical protein